MAGKDYYLVLGISRGESPGGIRKAFHDLALRHHPDRAGPRGTPMFREVVEAYRVLSDPRRRREHDAELAESDLSPARARRVYVRRPVRHPPAGLFGEPGSIHPGAEELFERILRNFASVGIGKGEHVEPLLCDVAVTREEALRGGVLPIRIPATEPCPSCHGTGRVALFPCIRCDASGRAAMEITVPLEIPPGLRSGTILEASLDRWGIRNLWLRARVRIAE